MDQNEEISAASWFRDAIVYHILIDRFAGYQEETDWKKPVFMGGNFRGIKDKIGYLSRLGINTIWLSPVNKTTAYHGYHITDFFDTDKHFGTLADLKELLEEAHRRTIRVILDFVPNHCSRFHPYFCEAYSDRKSKYRVWFYFNRNNSYRCFLDYPDLPKVNLECDAARKHMIDAAKFWLGMGFDGFRLDHAVGPTHGFWREFRREVKSTNPEAILIAEAWLQGIRFNMLHTIQIKNKYFRWIRTLNPADIQKEYIGEFDGALDFYFRQRITEFIAWKEDPGLYEDQMKLEMKRHYGSFPETYYLPTFVDNHDMNRFLFDAGQNRDKLKQALKFQFSLPHPPVIYYGTETGLSHDLPVIWNVPFSDIQARKPMPWGALDVDMIDFCRGLISERKRQGI